MSFAGKRASALTVAEEDLWRREQASPQPGGRPPAPGQLALLQAFLNSHFDLGENWGADQLADPQALTLWLLQRDLISAGEELSQPDAERARTVREALRRLIADSACEPDVWRMANQAVAGATLGVQLTGEGMRLVPTGTAPLDRALGNLLGIAASAMLDGSWSRLKSCPGHHCGWVFFDLSRNNSGRWCSMNVCGGREKARAHYHRQRERRR